MIGPADKRVAKKVAEDYKAAKPARAAAKKKNGPPMPAMSYPGYSSSPSPDFVDQSYDGDLDSMFDQKPQQMMTPEQAAALLAGTGAGTHGYHEQDNTTVDPNLISLQTPTLAGQFGNLGPNFDRDSVPPRMQTPQAHLAPTQVFKHQLETLMRFRNCV